MLLSSSNKQVKKVIIIGASSGMGRELALILNKEGYQVAATARREALLKELKNIKTANFDITQSDSLEKNLNNLVEQLGGLDLLVNFAGTGNLNYNLDFKLEAPTVETNVKAFTQITDWAVNYFLRQKYGHLVSISSVGGLIGSAEAPAYSASKAYQINYLEGITAKIKKLKLPITITDVRPGFVDTAMAKGEGIFWKGSAKKAAEQILQAIQKKQEVVYVSKRWVIIATIINIMPRWLRIRL